MESDDEDPIFALETDGHSDEDPVVAMATTPPERKIRGSGRAGRSRAPATSGQFAAWVLVSGHSDDVRDIVGNGEMREEQKQPVFVLGMCDCAWEFQVASPASERKHATSLDHRAPSKRSGAAPWGYVNYIVLESWRLAPSVVLPADLAIEVHSLTGPGEIMKFCGDHVTEYGGRLSETPFEVQCRLEGCFVWDKLFAGCFLRHRSNQYLSLGLYVCGL